MEYPAPVYETVPEELGALALLSLPFFVLYGFVGTGRLRAGRLLQ